MTVDILLSYTVNHTIDLHCKEMVWVTLESRLYNSGADQSFPVSFSRASFSKIVFTAKLVPKTKKQNGSIVIKVGKW
jgi:hypothetical protein